MCFGLQAQLTDGSIAPDFTVTDVDGNTHTLYDYTSQGKAVILHIFAAWSGPDWNYVQTGALNTVWDDFGPNGTDEMMVISVHGDLGSPDFDNQNDLNGTSNATQGNWISALNGPIIPAINDGQMIVEDYNISYYPTIYMIYPGNFVVEAGQMNADDLFDLAFNTPTGFVLNGVNNVAAIDYDNEEFFCGATTPIFLAQNLGSANLTSFDATLSVNGVAVQTVNWTGNLAPFEEAQVNFDGIDGFGEMEFELSLSNPNGMTDDDDSDNSYTHLAYGPFHNIGEEFTLSLTPDNFPQEISLEVIDPNGMVVFELTGDDFENGVETIVDINDLNLVMEGCYTLNIYDTFGDGLIFGNNSGAISLTNNGVVIYDNPAYNDLLSVHFYNLVDYDYGATAVAFNDANGNGVFDANEDLLFNQAFSLDPDEVLSFTNIDGATTFLLDEMSDYTLNFEGNPLWNLSTPGSVDFSTGTEEFDETYYFGLTPAGNFTLQDIDLSSSINRCNWDVNFWLTYTNVGTTTNDGFVELILDSLTNFVSANPTADSVSTDGNLYWFYTDLAPTFTNQIQVVIAMPGVEAIDETMDFEANIETWEGTGTNKAILSSELACSYDPNDKLVSPSGYAGDPKNFTLFEDELEYTVRFQNTGNDTAFVVQILDELDPKLDLSTFRVISSSHPVETTLDMASREVAFLFENIFLPDSFVNEPASHGFIKYSIAGLDGLDEFSEIQNTAGIYFDQNPPVITNTVANTMVSELPTPAVLASSPGELDFGMIEPGVATTLDLAIQNVGDLELIVTEIITENNAFVPNINAFTVSGGSEQMIAVTFTPTQEIPYVTNLILKSNVGDLPIVLKGVGSTDTGIEDIQIGLTVSPNPSTDLFLINWDNEDQTQLAVFDINGKELLSLQTTANQYKLDLSDQPKGVYFLKLQTPEGSVVKKLILK